MKAFHVPVLAAPILLVALAIATGCGDDRPAIETTGTTDLLDGSASSSGDGGGVVFVSEPNLCDAVTQRSQVIAELALLGAPDAPLGGTLVPGTYVLNELRAYGTAADGGFDPGPPAPTGHYARATMVVTARSLRTLRADGDDPDALPADALKVVEYAVSGTTLASTSACTTPGVQATGTYSADANYITLFPAPNRVEVFVLRTY